MPYFSDFNELDSANRNPTRGPTTSFMENAGAAFDSFVEGSTTISLALNVDQQIDEISQRVQQVTGQNIEPSVGERIMGEDRGLTRVPPEFLERAREAVRNNPETLGDLPTTEDAIRDRIRREVQASEQEAADIAERAGISGTLGGFAGTLGGSLTDPALLASLAAGAPASAGIIRTALIEAGIGAASEVPIQAAVQTQRANIGLDAGLDRALRNIAAAGVGGGILAGGIRGVELGTRKALGFDTRQAAETAEQAGLTEASADVKAAAENIKRQTDIESNNPFTRAFPENNAVFNRVFDETLSQLRDEGVTPGYSTNIPVRDEALPEGRTVNENTADTPANLIDRDVIRDFTEFGRMLKAEIRTRADQQTADAVRSVVTREARQVRDPQALARTLQSAEEIEDLRRAFEQRRKEARRPGATSQKKAAVTRAERQLRQRIGELFPRADEDAVEELVQGESRVQQALRTVQQSGQRRSLSRLSRRTPDEVANELRGMVEQKPSSAAMGRSFARATAVARNAERILEDQDTQIERLRQSIEDDIPGDLEVSVVNADGKQLTSVRGALDDLDDEQRLRDEIRNCLGVGQQ